MVNKFTFICETGEEDKITERVTAECEFSHIDDILGQFKAFLNASGFHIDGELGVIDE